MAGTDKAKLWESYRTKPTQELRQQLIVEYAPLVKVVAGKLTMYLGNNVEYDDLVGYGVFGLIDAIDKFDLTKDVKFETYASLRIKGAILDQIRKMDWIPRTLRQKQRKIDDAAKEIEAATGKVATDEQIAAHLEISEEELLDWQGQLKVTNVISLNEFMEQGGEPNSDYNATSHYSLPEEKVSKDELKKVLADAIETLTEKEKKVILMYYYEELTLKEIAQVLDVSESRVSQLHTKALNKMKKIMGSYMGVLIG